MADQENLLNRIPAEQLGEVASWSLPQIKDNKTAIKSAAREAQERKQAKKQSEQKPVEQQGESVEEVEAVEVLKPLTAEELSQISEEARKEGFDIGRKEGFDKGETEGFNKGQKSGETKAFQQTLAKRNEEINSLKSIANNLMFPMQEQQEHLENIIVEMAVNLAKRLLVSEIQQSPSSLYNLVHHALSALPAGGENIKVHLNPQDASLIKGVLPTANQWHIVEDPSLSSGSCHVANDTSLVDFTVEERLKAYLEEVESRGEVSDDSLPEVAVYREEEEQEQEQEQEQEEKGATVETETEAVTGSVVDKLLDEDSHEKNNEKLSPGAINEKLRPGAIENPEPLVQPELKDIQVEQGGQAPSKAEKAEIEQSVTAKSKPERTDKTQNTSNMEKKDEDESSP